MTTLHSNHPYFQPAEHIFFRNLEQCELGCDAYFHEDDLEEMEVDGELKKCCHKCKTEYIFEQSNLVAIKYSGDVNETF